MRALRTRLAESMRSAAETHIALLATLEADPLEDPLIKGLAEGTVAYLKADRRRERTDTSASPSHTTSADLLPGLPPAEPGKDTRRG